MTSGYDTFLAAMIKASPNIDKNNVTEVCENFFKVMVDTVKNGEVIEFKDGFIFKLAERCARSFLDPMTKQITNIPAKYGLSISMNDDLKSKIADVEVTTELSEKIKRERSQL